MKIAKATRLYEEYLASHVDLVTADLARKHEAMARSPFYFLRATFYRWAQRFAAECQALLGAPEVRGVGDLHVENFGTWRDAEGRLCWGVNDFDEACPLPYANDLVRLVLSAWLAVEESDLRLPRDAATLAVLAGYRHGLEEDGQPFVLDEEHRWLNALAHHQARDPERFWKKLEGMRPLDADELPRQARARLLKAMPEEGLALRFGHRVAGIGSLGRPRYVAMARWHGAWVARETKPLVPSAWRFAQPGAREGELHYEEVVTRAVRSPDPFLRVERGWVLRRLSPICTRVELAALPDERDEERLLHAMGVEAANVHLGTRGARKEIRRDLAERPAHWLREAAEAMEAAVRADHRAWVERDRGEPG